MSERSLPKSAASLKGGVCEVYLTKSAYFSNGGNGPVPPSLGKKTFLGVGGL